MGIRVLKGGMMTTVQDLGRTGYQSQGFSVSGVMDVRSFKIANLLLDNPDYVPQVVGIMTNTMLHKIAPIMAVIDFVLFDPHRRFRWHYMFSWLAYFPAYLVFVLARAAIWPGSGPAAGGSPYPYDFINLDALGWQGFGISCGKLAIAFFVISLVVWLLDRALPSKALLG